MPFLSIYIRTTPVQFTTFSLPLIISCPRQSIYKYISSLHHSSATASMADKQHHGRSSCCCLFGTYLMKDSGCTHRPCWRCNTLISRMAIQPRSFKFHATEADVTHLSTTPTTPSTTT